MKKGTGRIDDAQYVQGQIDGLRAIILGLANRLLDEESFLAESLERLESVRTAVTFSQASDAWLDGLNDQEVWILAVCGARDAT